MRQRFIGLHGLASIALGAVFLCTAAAKITQIEVLPIGPSSGPHVFAYVIERNGLIPGSWSLSVAIGVIASEILIAL